MRSALAAMTGRVDAEQFHGARYAALTSAGPGADPPVEDAQNAAVTPMRWYQVPKGWEARPAHRRSLHYGLVARPWKRRSRLARGPSLYLLGLACHPAPVGAVPRPAPYHSVRVSAPRRCPPVAVRPTWLTPSVP